MRSIYLDTAQVAIVGLNPKLCSICERINQTLGAMVRKPSDLEYKYKDLCFHLPRFEFMINILLYRLRMVVMGRQYTGPNVTVDTTINIAQH